MKITQTHLLHLKYKQSLKMLKKEVESVHSKTLEEIYTPQYKPAQTHQGRTTIKNKQNNKIVDVFIKGLGPDLKKNRLGREYRMYKNHFSFALGIKNFGLKTSDIGYKKPIMSSGCIKSRKRKKYAGTQIRLLQIACELAKKYDIKSIPLISLNAPVQFHTMMGFRPKESYDFKINSLEDYQTSVKDLKCIFLKHFDSKEIKVVVSKNEFNEYFIDSNRSLYCSTMEKVKKIQELTHQKYLKNDDTTFINMSLSGKELEKWFERMKGFEILPDNELINKK